MADMHIFNALHRRNVDPDLSVTTRDLRLYYWFTSSFEDGAAVTRHTVTLDTLSHVVYIFSLILFLSTKVLSPPNVRRRRSLLELTWKGQDVGHPISEPLTHFYI